MGAEGVGILQHDLALDAECVNDFETAVFI